MADVYTSNSIIFFGIRDGEKGEPGDSDASLSLVLQYDFDSIVKFSGENNSWDYSPSFINIGVKQITDTSASTPLDNVLICEYYYEGGSGVYPELTPEGKYEVVQNLVLNLAAEPFAGKEINHLKFKVLNGSDPENNIELLTEIKTVNYGTTEDSMKFDVYGAKIVAAIDEHKIEFSDQGLKVYNGGFKITNTNSTPPVDNFYVDEDGNIFFAGTLESGSGTIGGWTICEEGLYSTNRNVGLFAKDRYYYPNDVSPIRFWAGRNGTDIDAQYNFAVTQTGTLYANQANIIGNIIAETGRITNHFYVGDTNNGIEMYGGNNAFIGSAKYSSGALGCGWRIDADGTAEFTNATIHGTITSAVFQHERISSIGGSLYIAPTIYADVSSSNLQLNEGQYNYQFSWDIPKASLDSTEGYTWQIQDVLKIEGEIDLPTGTFVFSNADAEITDFIISDDEQIVTITVQCKIDNPNLKDAIINPGAIIVLYGKGGQRNGLYMTASGGNSPYLDVYSVDSTTVPAVRLGNLAGISDPIFNGVQFSGFGLYSSNAFLRGQLRLPGAGITNQITYTYGDNNSPIRIWAGTSDTNEDITSANFIVTEAGYLYAHEGLFEGTVRATNSEFSGTIKAAGILINDSLVDDYTHDHFYVAYDDGNIPTPSNYIIDIGSKGLSIWEGALRAYSDFASGENIGEVINSIYGYSNNNQNPQPYFYLVDNGQVNNEEITIDARFVANKGHIVSYEQENNLYTASSIIFNKGIWFNEQDASVNLPSEDSIFRNNIAGFNLLNKNLQIEADNNIIINTKTTYITKEPTDVNNDSHTEALFVRGNIKISDRVDNAFYLNTQKIQEATTVDENGNINSIGINIIISDE